jgi:hypothetical protein
MDEIRILEKRQLAKSAIQVMNAWQMRYRERIYITEMTIERLLNWSEGGGIVDNEPKLIRRLERVLEVAKEKGLDPIRKFDCYDRAYMCVEHEFSGKNGN